MIPQTNRYLSMDGMSWSKLTNFCLAFESVRSLAMPKGEPFPSTKSESSGTDMDAVFLQRSHFRSVAYLLYHVAQGDRERDIHISLHIALKIMQTPPHKGHCGGVPSLIKCINGCWPTKPNQELYAMVRVI